MAPNLSLFSVNAILLLSTDDRTRILTKYYSAPHQQPGQAKDAPGTNPYTTVKEQKAFEKGLLEKTNKSSGDIILYDGRVVCYKTEGDVMIYVVGGAEENEILLFQTVLALRDALSILLKYVCSILLRPQQADLLACCWLLPYVARLCADTVAEIQQISEP